MLAKMACSCSRVNELSSIIAAIGLRKMRMTRSRSVAYDSSVASSSKMTSWRDCSYSLFLVRVLGEEIIILKKLYLFWKLVNDIAHACLVAPKRVRL